MNDVVFFIAAVGTVCILCTIILLTALLFIHYTIKKNHMATEQQFTQLLDRIDAATNNIAAELKSLKDQIAGAGLPANVEEQVLARLTSAAAQLEGVGKEEVPPEGTGNADMDAATPDEGEGAPPAEGQSTI